MKFQFIVNQMISLFFICAFSVSVSGQEITWGEVQKSPEMSAYIEKFITSDDENTYAIRYYSLEKIYFEKFDKNLSLVSSNKLNLEHEGKNLIYKDLLCYGKHSKLITSFHNKKQEKRYLFAQDFDLKTQKTSAPKTILTIEKGNNIEAYGSYMKLESVQIKFSKDSSKIAVICDLFDDDEKQIISIDVFDTDFNLIWQKKQKFDFLHTQNEINDIFLSNDGDIYISTVRSMYDERGRKDLGAVFIVYEWLNNGEKFNDYPILIEDVNVASAEVIRVGDETKVIGRYTLRGTTATTKGIYCGELNSNLKSVQYLKINEIKYEDLADIHSDYRLNYDFKEYNELIDYYISDVVINANNTVSVILFREYSNVIIINYANDFSVKWITADLNGRQVVVEDKNTLFIINQKDNIDLLNIIQDDGSLKTIEMKSKKEGYMYPIGRNVSFYTKDKEIIFYRRVSKKKYYLGRVKIK